MNHPEIPQGGLHARGSEIIPATKSSELDEAYGDAFPNSRRLSFRMLARAVRRHWWQAGLLWIAGSVGLMALAYAKVKPTYDAFAQVKVEPGERGLFDRDYNANSNFDNYKQTQVNQATSPPVLATALSSNPRLLALPRLAKADDPEAEIRQSLRVGIIPGTNLIQVSMSSELVLEAVQIVNAVVQAYLKHTLAGNDQETEKRTAHLRELHASRLRERDAKRDALTLLQKKLGMIDVQGIKDRNTVTIDTYSFFSSQLVQIEVEITEAESRLRQLQEDQTTPAAVEDPKAAEEVAMDLFYGNPKVADLSEALERYTLEYRRNKKIVRNPGDPSLAGPRRRMEEIQSRLDDMWTKMRPALIAQLQSRGFDGPGGALREAELKVAGLKAKEGTYLQKLNDLKIQQRREGNDAMELEFARRDLQTAEEMLGIVERGLNESEFQAKNPIGRVNLEFLARPSSKPNTNNRLKVMAVAPIGMMFGVLGLMMLIELNAGRVVDPEDIPSRVHVPVIGVVPPLPQVRPIDGWASARDEFRSQKQFDQFVQSLDHLRVALCASRTAWGRERRCILITSACGGEGKTTLAAQLAERCVNAGLSTLLIDSDLRNPTLTRMLDYQGRPGLINILRGEAIAEDAISIVNGGGGFHFLPAGAPKIDPSRLLHGDRFSKLLEQSRERFDIVIVDAPPVLPVPDALTIGRWTDGALLAIRYDNSRFPLVEKANRRLAAVGVSVIGAVVNGVRLVDSAYGSYYPSYGYSYDQKADAPIDV